MKRQTRIWLMSAALAGLIGYQAVAMWPRPDGCPTYIPVKNKLLIAHAGGGLPNATYTNGTRAMDLAVRHGFKLIEIDFWQRQDRILLSHDRPKGTEPEVEVLLSWMRENPDVLIVTDFKTDNVQGLSALVRRAGSLRQRFVPQIYNPSEYGAVTALGMQKPIFTLYRVSEPWRDFAASADLRAVTFPEDKRDWARVFASPFLFTRSTSPNPMTWPASIPTA